MRYGTFLLADALGAVLAHSVKITDRRFPKGHVLCSADIDCLRAEGVSSVIAVHLEPGDVGENEAAAEIGDAIHGAHLRRGEASTGRVNIYATANGLFVADRHVVDALNDIDPAITLACLADRVAVKAGDMIATIKIIPLAVHREKIDAAVRILQQCPPCELKPFRPRSVTLVATELPSLKSSVMDRTAKLLEQRLAKSGSRLVNETRVAHDGDALASVLQRVSRQEYREPAMIVIFGASAVVDPEDVIPAAIRAAGGVVDHIGMPVDPGNLLVLGHIGDIPVIGAPGCARSPKENGFDWILDRIMAGERPNRRDISGMGVGGLLMEITSRPQPREVDEPAMRPVTVAAVLLAAGQARRMGGQERAHKLLAEFDGVPLVRRSAEMLLSADISSLVAVTGHRRMEVEAALGGLAVDFRFNADYDTGMASSLISAFSHGGTASHDGVLVMLADMPAVTKEHVDTLVRAFQEAEGRCVVRSVSGGKRGNPVILPKASYPAVLRLEGDIGARAIIEGAGLDVIDVDIGPAAHIDVDTPEEVIAAGGVIRG
jgi:molybdenum cofactor cytidylyltransferase